MGLGGVVGQDLWGYKLVSPQKITMTYDASYEDNIFRWLVFKHVGWFLLA